MDEFEVTYHGDPPERREESLAETVIKVSYYNCGGCFLVCIFVLTPIFAVIIALYNR